jgi:hypothetical protein
MTLIDAEISSGQEWLYFLPPPGLPANGDLNCNAFDFLFCKWHNNGGDRTYVTPTAAKTRINEQSTF